MTGPEKWGQEQPTWLASGDKANSISAPSTPWHRPAGCAEECHTQGREDKNFKQAVPPVNTCTTDPSIDTAAVCQNQAQGAAPAQPTQGPHSMSNCTVCGLGHHFKTPATQDITAVACEMMTLVSMRTAMSEVLGNLVHKWRDVMPSSLDLPGMQQKAGTVHASPEKGACMQTGGPDGGWTIPASAGASKQSCERESVSQDNQKAAASRHSSPNEIPLMSQPRQLSAMPVRARLLQGRTSPHATGVHGSGALAHDEASVEKVQDRKVLDRGTAEVPTAGNLRTTAGNDTSRERNRRHEAKAAKKSHLQRDDSMSGPYQVTFAPGVPTDSAKRTKKRSSRHSRSSQKQRLDKKPPATAEVIPEHSPAAHHLDDQQAVSIATQEAYSSSGLDWTESAVSVATDTVDGSASVATGQRSALLVPRKDATESDRIVLEEDMQEVARVEGIKARGLSAQSQASRSESMWPISDDDTAPMEEDSSTSGAVQTHAAVGGGASAMPVENDSIASGTHSKVRSSTPSEVKSSCSSRSKVLDSSSFRALALPTVVACTCLASITCRRLHAILVHDMFSFRTIQPLQSTGAQSKGSQEQGQPQQQRLHEPFSCEFEFLAGWWYSERAGHWREGK